MLEQIRNRRMRIKIEIKPLAGRKFVATDGIHHAYGRTEQQAKCRLKYELSLKHGYAAIDEV